MKIKSFLVATVLLFSVSAAVATPLTNTTAPNAKSANMTKEQMEARMEEMRQRVQEIKTMDKSELTKEQRKELRHELKDMNKEAREYGHRGVFISVGALIIIILLLIIIL